MVQLLRKAKSSHWAGKQNLIQSPIQSQDYSNFTVLKEVGMSERPTIFITCLLSVGGAPY